MALLLVPVLSWAGFVNGDFEVGTAGVPPPSPWTVTSYVNQGIGHFPPSTEADLNLQFKPPTGTPPTATVAGPGPDPLVSQLRHPPWGTQAVGVNLGGKSASVNRLSQTATMGTADVDPIDGRVHIRFAVAPVLENPTHLETQQPYVFIEIRNLTQGNRQIFNRFLFAGQPDVSWKAVRHRVLRHAGPGGRGQRHAGAHRQRERQRQCHAAQQPVQCWQLQPLYGDRHQAAGRSIPDPAAGPRAELSRHPRQDRIRHRVGGQHTRQPGL